ncbi:MAG TPA: copper resistance protein CopC [Actinomycetota bacterium]
MTRRRGAGSAVLLALAGALFLAAPAGAHALLRSSEPADGQELSEPPSTVVLELTEPPELSLTEVRVLDGSGGDREVGEAAAAGAEGLTVDLPPLEQGVYTVVWRVVSRVDGHPSAGTFAFGVGVSPAEAPPPPGLEVPTTPPASPLEMAGRAGLFLGLGLLLGASWIGALAFRRAPSRVVRLALAGAAFALVATAVLATAQARSAGASLGELSGTLIGRALILRAAAAVTALLALSLGRGRRWTLGLAGAAAAGALLAHVAAGHANEGRFAWAQVGFQWTHVVAGAVWLGGLAALIVGIRGEPDEAKAAAVRRFSLVAGGALAAVALTGVLRALDEVNGWGELLSTGYGRLVVIKSGLIVALAGLGAVNRYRNVPAAATSLRGLRRTSRVELSIAVGLVAAAAGLATLVPPASVPAAVEPPAPIDVRAADFGTTVQARLQVTPGVPGPNRFRLLVTDFDTGDPVAGARVELRFGALGRPDVPVATLALEEAEEGVYQATGSPVALAGPWEVTALVQQGGDSVDVQLRFATVCRTTDVEAESRPPIHLQDLPGGGTVEGYVLPLGGARYEVHFTFLDPDGREVFVPEAPDALASHPDEDPRTVPMIPLGRGHFVGETELEDGAWRFDVVADPEEGGAISGCFEERIPTS